MHWITQSGRLFAVIVANGTPVYVPYNVVHCWTLGELSVGGLLRVFVQKCKANVIKNRIGRCCEMLDFLTHPYTLAIIGGAFGSLIVKLAFFLATQK
jgi:hypothetical protein